MNLPQREKYYHPNTISWYTIDVVNKYKQYADDNFAGYSSSENEK